MVITSLAGTISIGRFGAACFASSARTTFCSPTSKIRTPNSRAASTLPSTSGRGAWSNSRVRRVGLTAALFVVEVRPAIRAQAAAVALADHLQRQRQQHLLLQHVRQEESFSLVESNLSVIVLQPVLFVLDVLRQRSIKEVKRTAHFLDHRLQTTRTHQFDLRFEVALDSNLPFQQLRRRRHFQRLNLL